MIVTVTRDERSEVVDLTDNEGFIIALAVQSVIAGIAGDLALVMSSAASLAVVARTLTSDNYENAQRLTHLLFTDAQGDCDCERCVARRLTFGDSTGTPT